MKYFLAIFSAFAFVPSGDFRFRLSLYIRVIGNQARRFSISRALARTEADTSVPAIIRASYSSLARTPSGATPVTVRPSLSVFAIR